MARFINKLLEEYAEGGLSDEELLQAYQRAEAADEYYGDLHQQKIRTRLQARQDENIAYCQSAEKTVLDREREKKIIHFFSWIQSILTEEEWKMWSMYITDHKLTFKDIGEIFNKSQITANRKVNAITKKIRKLVPLYDEQFGNLQEYLED